MSSAYGSAGEHAGFAGTLSIGQAALEAVAVELVRSADAFAGVVLVSGHGGNEVPPAAPVRHSPFAARDRPSSPAPRSTPMTWSSTGRRG